MVNDSLVDVLRADVRPLPDSAVGVPTFVATCDLVAQVRGRAVPVTAQQRVFETGVGWVPADLAITGFGSIAQDNLFGSAGDLRLLPDDRSLVLVPSDGESPGVRLVLADLVELDGSPWPGCPRGFLRAALDELYARHGLRVVASFEHEFVVRGASGAPFSWQRSRAVEPFGTRLLTLLADCGLQPETWLPEYGPEQFEITIAPAEGVTAADRAILLRELVRDLARRLGREVTFAPMLSATGVGSGVHVHLSLVDNEGSPMMAEAGGTSVLSDLGLAFCGGILAHAPALLAISAPSVASFLRLRPHQWSVGAAVLAERDREGLLRVCPTSSLAGQARVRQVNVEFRAADATANPWLVLGSLVRAGLDGLDGRIPPARVLPEGSDVLADPNAQLLPRSLPTALAALEADRVARSWFPKLLLETYLSVKHAELDQARDLNEDEACQLVAHAY